MSLGANVALFVKKIEERCLKIKIIQCKRNDMVDFNATMLFQKRN